MSKLIFVYSFLNLFISLFVLYSCSHHVFKFKRFNDNIDSLNFKFYYDLEMNYVKSTITQTDIQSVIGDIKVDVVTPVTER